MQACVTDPRREDFASHLESCTSIQDLTRWPRLTGTVLGHCDAGDMIKVESDAGEELEIHKKSLRLAGDWPHGIAAK